MKGRIPLPQYDRGLAPVANGLRSRCGEDDGHRFQGKTSNMQTETEP